MREHCGLLTAVLDSDIFLDLPKDAQTLYIQLCLHADDDGLIGNPRAVLRLMDCPETHLQTLRQKGFILLFTSGVAAVVHWKLHEPTHPEHYRESIYLLEKNRLFLREDRTYALKEAAGRNLY